MDCPELQDPLAQWLSDTALRCCWPWAPLRVAPHRGSVASGCREPAARDKQEEASLQSRGWEIGLLVRRMGSKSHCSKPMLDVRSYF